MNTYSCPESRRGFTRADLLAVLVTLALLAVVTRPVWASAAGVKSLLCLDNLRRLSSAWLMFADDHEGRFAGNVQGGMAQNPTSDQGFATWAVGWLDWKLRTDNTNTVYLTDPRYAHLWPYLQTDVSVYKCPADDSRSDQQARRGWPLRARSYSMNSYVGPGNAATGPIDRRASFFQGVGNFRQLPPNQVFVFSEEHPDSINDPMFMGPRYDRWQWVDFPASFHAGSCSFTFADGHVEQHAWKNPAIVWPVTYGKKNPILSPTLPDDPDLIWLREHATELR